MVNPGADEEKIRGRFQDIAPQIHSSLYRHSRSNYLEFNSRSKYRIHHNHSNQFSVIAPNQDLAPHSSVVCLLI
uniref:Uncharacterized protein n=1 Tax=Lepeophtheirus salmonis TaxID=72036 RepID=A0A0K2TW57_LEPSM